MKLRKLSKHKLETIRKQVLRELNRRYKKKRVVKYGALNRGFTDEEKERFIAATNPAEHKLNAVFALEYGLGLRVGEACSTRSEDVYLADRRLWVRSAKDSVPTMFYLHDEVYTALLTYEAVRVKGEWYFPKQHEAQPSKYPYLSPDYVRRRFGEIRKAAGLDMPYAASEEPAGKRPRRLRRLTTHSFRHRFGRTVWRETGDLLMTQKLMRHVDINNTLIYVKVHQEELDQTIKTVFGKKH